MSDLAPRRISLDEAERIAIEALMQAEARRQAEREREAAFWSGLDSAGGTDGDFHAAAAT